MPHGKICYLGIPAKTAVKESDRTPDTLTTAFADPVGNELGLYAEPKR